MNTEDIDYDTMDIPEEFLRRYPGHAYPELLPSDVSLRFEMTKDTLFAVWYLPTEHQKLIMNTKKTIIQQDWCLADVDNPFEQIQKFYGEMKVLAVVSFSEMETLLERLEKPSGWSSFFFSNKVYFVESEGQKFWSSKKTGHVLLDGNFSDLQKVLEEGRSIFQDKKYSHLSDARGVQEGHPQDWITFMRDASDGNFLRGEYLKYFGPDGRRE